MAYLVGGVYELIGRNMLAIQFINAAVGAATPAVIYYIAQHLFNNVRVARLAAFLACFFPFLVLLSSQEPKGGIIVLELALSILATLPLIEKISGRCVGCVAACLLALFG